MYDFAMESPDSTPNYDSDTASEERYVRTTSRTKEDGMAILPL
jgi:hypothetical protein